MADIAFLLLIFFLVTTTIDTDKGLGIVLPPPGDMEIEIRKENILNCLINSQGKVLLDEEGQVSFDEINDAITKGTGLNKPDFDLTVKSFNEYNSEPSKDGYTKPRGT